MKNLGNTDAFNLFILKELPDIMETLCYWIICVIWKNIPLVNFKHIQKESPVFSTPASPILPHNHISSISPPHAPPQYLK